MDLVKQIKDSFEHNPSDLNKIRELLNVREFTKTELAEIAADFADSCFCEYRDALDPDVDVLTVENMHSNYVVDAIAMLLEFGLDANVAADGENVMWNAMWIDAPNVAASLLRLLLESGGDPNLVIPTECESLFEYVAVKVSYDEYTHDYFYTVQLWLLLMAYGGRFRNGNIPLEMLGGKTVDIFKDFERYDYNIEYLPQVEGKYGCWRMHVYDVETMEEVAIY